MIFPWDWWLEYQFILRETKRNYECLCHWKVADYRNLESIEYFGICILRGVLLFLTFNLCRCSLYFCKKQYRNHNFLSAFSYLRYWKRLNILLYKTNISFAYHSSYFLKFNAPVQVSSLHHIYEGTSSLIFTKSLYILYKTHFGTRNTTSARSKQAYIFHSKDACLFVPLLSEL